ncbi:MAG TPA: hypothetical protein PLS03_16925 [Terrimicrobiaceae bacterium]|nr:hypothetical protein [Terrimicrobiaceae bacterium]
MSLPTFPGDNLRFAAAQGAQIRGERRVFFSFLLIQRPDKPGALALGSTLLERNHVLPVFLASLIGMPPTAMS